MDPRIQKGIQLFNRREFFECHEVLEEVWTPEQGPRRLFLQALIHVAVGFYHHTRGNPTGAIRQLRKALRKLAGFLPVCEGMDTARLHEEALAVLRQIEDGSEVAVYPAIHMRESILMLEFAEVDPAHPEAVELIAALDRDIGARYPGMPVRGIQAAGFIEGGGLFLVGRVGGLAAACGAIRPIGEGMVEVKRMYVRPEFRRRGFASAVLVALEAAAISRGYHTVRLETGAAQPEAIALYLSAGYRAIPSFGEYETDARCRCFEKTL